MHHRQHDLQAPLYAAGRRRCGARAAPWPRSPQVRRCSTCTVCRTRRGRPASPACGPCPPAPQGMHVSANRPWGPMTRRSFTPGAVRPHMTTAASVVDMQIQTNHLDRRLRGRGLHGQGGQGGAVLLSLGTCTHSCMHAAKGSRRLAQKQTRGRLLKDQRQNRVKHRQDDSIEVGPSSLLECNLWCRASGGAPAQQPFPSCPTALSFAPAGRQPVRRSGLQSGKVR